MIKRIFSILFLNAFFSLSAFAAAPTLGTITPASGSIAPNTAVIFTGVYNDADGWENLKETYLLVSTSTTALANSAYLLFDANTNLLFLRDDANGSWLGGFAPGSSAVLENSQVKLDCAATTVNGSGTSLSVAYNLTFKPAFSGKAYSTYLSVVDDTGGKVNLTKKGAYTINTAPVNSSVTPSSGQGLPDTYQTFSTVHSDADGWQNIQYVYFIINTSASGTNGVYLYYNQNTNLLYLRDDANAAWLGGFAPGSANVIENSRARLDCAATTIVGNGADMTVNWSMATKPVFLGAKKLYLYTRDDLNLYQNWTQLGTWDIPNYPPVNVSVTPDSGQGLADTYQNFSTVFSDANGWAQIQYVYFIINTSASGTNGVYLYYNQNTNLLYLRNDANNAWLGGFAPGSANVIENSRARLDCAATTIVGEGTNLTVNWAIATKPVFLGVKKLYLYVYDDNAAYQTWTQKGTWEIPNYPPVNVSVTPSSGTGTPDAQQVFSTVYSDANGWEQIQYVYFIINTSASGVNGFQGYYNQNTNLLYIRNDAGNVWLGGFAPGSDNVIENTFVKLDCAQTTILGQGADLTVNWAVTIKPAFTGAKKLYLYVYDDNAAYQTWTQKGTWDITNHPPVNVSVAPASGNIATGALTTFNLEYSDPDTWQNIQYVYFLVNTATTSTANCFDFYYNLNTNKIYLRNDVGNAWLGGFAPGSANTIENNQAAIDCANIIVTGEGESLKLAVPVTFKSAFLGAKKLYLYVRDDVNAYQNWTQKGAVNLVSDNIPPQVFIDPVTTPTRVAAQTVTGTYIEENISTITVNGANATIDNVAKTFSADITLVEGENTIAVVATDLSGNTGTADGSVVLDTIPPAVPQGLSATAGDTVADLSWAANTETDLAGYNLYRSIASGGPYDKVNIDLLTSPNYSDSDLTNNTTYYYVVTAVDTIGNESDYSQEISAIFQPNINASLIAQGSFDAFSPNDDTVKDSTVISAQLSGIVDPTAAAWIIEIKNMSTGDVVRAFDENTDAGVDRLDVSWDGKDADGEVVPDGEYIFKVTASGNGFSVDVTGDPIRVDTAAPEILISAGTGENEYVNHDLTPEITVVDADPDPKAEITLNNQPFTSGTVITQESNYLLKVTAEDNAGNSSVNQLQFGIDKTPPVIISSYPANGGSVAAADMASGIRLNIVFGDNLSGISSSGDSVTLKDKDGNDLTPYCSLTLSNIEYLIEVVDNGQFIFRLHLTDNAGNAGDSEISFSVDSSAPEIIPSVLGGQYSSPFTVDLACSETAEIYYSIDGYPPIEGAANTTLVSGTHAQVPITATTDLQFFAVDPAGNRGQLRSEIYLFNELPEPASGLSGQYNAGAESVQLQWQTAADARGYNVYRALNIQEINILKESSERGYVSAARLRINSDLVSGAGYSDTGVEPGVKYWYGVSVVGQNGVEGRISELASVDVPVSTNAVDINAAIERGVAWVESKQAEGGYWGEQEEKYILATSQVLKAMKLTGKNNIWINRGLFYLRGHLADNNDYLARSILSQEDFGFDVSEPVNRLVSQAYFPVGGGVEIYGWSVQRQYGYDALTTALGRLVIHKYINPDFQCYVPRPIVLSSVIDSTDYALLDIPSDSPDYLKSQDGHYGWIPKQETSIFVSSLVYHALGAQQDLYQWIIDAQKADGSFGDGVIDTAASLLWIPLDAEAKADAISYIVSQQGANGGWNDNNAYVTGLCLEALLKNKE